MSSFSPYLLNRRSFKKNIFKLKLKGWGWVENVFPRILLVAHHAYMPSLFWIVAQPHRG